MRIDIITKRVAKEMIKEEVEKKFRRELDIFWKNLNKLNDRIRILENERI